MPSNNILENKRILAIKVKKTSNIATVAFVAFMAYTISQWQSAIGIDNFFNLLVLTLIMAINIKFYQIYLNLNSYNIQGDDLSIKTSCKQDRREYNQLTRASIWIVVTLVMIKLLLH